MNQKHRAPSFKIRAATDRDVPSAIGILVRAFEADPLMRFLFYDHPAGRDKAVSTFFSLLLRVRISLSMPALVLEQHGAIQGAVMGYAPSPPPWPNALDEEWRVFEASGAKVKERMERYDAICDKFKPAAPHHYLGVIGVDPGMQGSGAGKRLLEAFCDLACKDTQSSGVYLETMTPKSLEFYLRNKFEICGTAELDGDPIWCVFRQR